MSEEEVKVEPEAPGQAGFAVYPVEGGVGLNVVDTDGTGINMVLTPEDAGRVAISFLSTIAIVQFQSLNRMAAERAEMERIRQMIENKPAK